MSLRFPTASPPARLLHRSFTTVAVCLALIVAVPPAAGSRELHVRPVPGEVTAPYDPPERNWLPGHRGVDLAAGAGAPVRSSGSGVVHFAGSVAGTPTVSVRHTGGVRTTYQPVEATVEAGQVVERGQVIGSLADDSHPGLHWGALRGQSDYLNPMDLLGRRRIVLKPL